MRARPWEDLPANTPLTVTPALPATSGATIFIETTVPTMAFHGLTGNASDQDLWFPMAERVFGKIDSSNTRAWDDFTGSGRDLGGGFRDVPDLDDVLFSVATGDGAGSDTENAIPYEAIGNRYVLAQPDIGDYFIGSDQSCEVRVYDKDGTELGVHTLNGTSDAPDSVQVGVASGGDEDAISSNGPFYFTGTAPFGLRVNSNQDEYVAVGYRSELRNFAGANGAVASAYHASTASADASAAGVSAASAETSMGVASRLLGKGHNPDPGFVYWDGGEPTYADVIVTSGQGTWAQDEGKYGSSVLLDVSPNPANNGPYLRLSTNSTVPRNLEALNVDDLVAVQVSVELELVDGAFSGDTIMVRWNDGTTTHTDTYAIDEKLTNTTGMVQTYEFIAYKNEDYAAAGSSDTWLVVDYVTTSTLGLGLAEHTVRVHRLDFVPVYNSAAASLEFKTYNALESAAVLKATVSGTEASISAEAFDNLGVPFSRLTFDADVISFEGSWTLVDGVQKSGNYSEDVDGNPLTGVQINWTAGEVKAKGIFSGDAIISGTYDAVLDVMESNYFTVSSPASDQEYDLLIQEIPAAFSNQTGDHPITLEARVLVNGDYDSSNPDTHQIFWFRVYVGTSETGPWEQLFGSTKMRVPAPERGLGGWCFGANSYGVAPEEGTSYKDISAYTHLRFAMVPNYVLGTPPTGVSFDMFEGKVYALSVRLYQRIAD